MAVEMSQEQLHLLAVLEEEFADRYTEKDPDYTKVVTPSAPPVIYPWYNHARRQYDYTDNHRSRERDRERWRGKQQHHRRDRDRHENRHQPYHRYR